ncbi:hypothetical protein JD844_013988, partial [Phrynosoma platyrhinos]
MRNDHASTLVTPVEAGSTFPIGKATAMANRWQIWLPAEVEALYDIMGASRHLPLLMGSSSHPNHHIYRCLTRRLACRGFLRNVAQVRSKVKVLRNVFYRARALFHGDPPVEGHPPFYRQLRRLWKQAGHPNGRHARRPPVVKSNLRKAPYQEGSIINLCQVVGSNDPVEGSRDPVVGSKYSLHPYLSDFGVYNASLDGMYLDESGGLTANFDIQLTVVWPNNTNKKVKFGGLERQESPGKKLHLEENTLAWLRDTDQ